MTSPNAKWAYLGVGLVIAALLTISSAGLMGAGEIDTAPPAQEIATGLNLAAADIQKAWTEALRADALAVSGTSAAEAQAMFDAATARYQQNAAVLSSVGVAEIDQAIAGLNSGFNLLTQSFAGTGQLAATQGPAAAAANHLQGSTAIMEGVAAAFAGLGAVGAAADTKVADALYSGASTLRMLSIAGVVVGGLGALALIYGGLMAYVRRDSASYESARSDAEYRAA